MLAEQIELYKSNIPLKTRSCNDFSRDNKVRYIQQSLKKKYIQINDFNSVSWLSFDIDRPVCPESIIHDNLAPEPTIFIQNPKNGHAHLLYLLNTPVHKNYSSSNKAIKYLAAVETGLNHILSADTGFTGLLTKNPLHKDWRVLHATQNINTYDLFELNEYIKENLIKIRDKEQIGIGRNVLLFDAVRKWAYKEARKTSKNLEDRIITYTLSLNKALINPLDIAECYHIAKSITKFVSANFSQAKFTASQSKKGQKGGKAKGQAYAKIRSKVIELHNAGFKNKDISKVLNIHRNTVRNYLL